MNCGHESLLIQTILLCCIVDCGDVGDMVATWNIVFIDRKRTSAINFATMFRYIDSGYNCILVPRSNSIMRNILYYLSKQNSQHWYE